MVARLKLQVQELKEELTMATGEERTDELTEEEKKTLALRVCTYMLTVAQVDDPVAYACEKLPYI